MTIKRSTIGILILTLSGVITFLFLAELTDINDIPRIAYRIWLRRLLWPSIFMLCLSVIGFNRLSDVVISSDKAYEFYRKRKYDLIDNMGFGEMKYTKISILIISWLTCSWIGTIAACVAARIILGG